MVDQEYDVIIVGARVAGATVAALLGDAGCTVLLVDTGTFPSPTLSTHFFRGGGLVTVLNRLDVLDQVLALGAPQLVHQYFYANGSSEPDVGPPQNPGAYGYCLSVRREPLDFILVQRAMRASSVHMLQRTRVRELLWEHGRVIGGRLEGLGGEQHTVRSKLVVGADGRRSIVARSVDAKLEEAAPPYRALYYRYVRGYDGPAGETPDGAEFSLLEDELAYVFPSDDGLTCIALSINAADFPSLRKSPTERFGERIRRHRGIADRFVASVPEGRTYGSGPEPNYVRVPVGPGWALVGDAGLHQDPFTGLGMDMAGVHATFLAEAVRDWLGGSTSEAQAMATYHRHRNEHALPSYRQTVTLAPDLRQLITG